MKEHVLHSLYEAKSALDRLLSNASAIEAITLAGDALIDAFRNGHRVFSCGNGGSMCDAMHFAEELSGRYRHDRRGLPAVAISDPGHISCVANDYGYEHVFSRYLESHAQAGDCLVGISTSGGSENVIRSARLAREMGMVVIALTGRPASSLGQLADIEICTPGGMGYADRVQELHIKVIHILIELVERELFPGNYEASHT
ncbi:MAG: phosphoheptose isomerase [Candidatus Entotheonella factor]|uniref:Phosphoheptose isomerase n=1 Tax=Entotheonella factor TaxID=1429438 RepID=W4L931_ENTF1|nr:SIS domain-containing protein [Candidatus Entotheonella palauensis]ETW94542.1 MAG: phosphoheptose isomerase [Candidatus Entotheonella factor]